MLLFRIHSWTNEKWAWMDDLFTQDELEQIEIKFSKKDNQKAVLATGLETSVRNSNVEWVSEIDATNSFIYSKLTYAATELNKYFDYDLDVIETCQFTTYKKNSFYKAHRDMGVSAGYARKLTLVVQLSEASQYEGGELVLYTDGIDNPEVMSKKKGRVVAFPSWMLHEVLPVKHGKRHSLVAWVQGKKFR